MNTEELNELLFEALKREQDAEDCTMADFKEHFISQFDHEGSAPYKILKVVDLLTLYKLTDDVPGGRSAVWREVIQHCRAQSFEQGALLRYRLASEGAMTEASRLISEACKDAIVDGVVIFEVKW